jgi:hypothetical protein
MKGKPCFHGAACSYAHAPLRDRATCWQYERYGTCARSLERERLAADDPAAPPPPACWFPHPPCPAFDAHVAIQCDLGASARVVRRCRELVGPSAVVASARADLRRDGNCLVYVRGDDTRAGGGAAGVARALAEDPHALAAVKRVFLVQDARTCVGGDLPEAFDDALGACVAAALEEARHAEVRKAVTSGSKPPARLRVRARCFPKRGFAARRVASSLEEAERTLSGADAVVEACPNANRATHVLDVVCAKNRAHVKVWSSTEVVLEEEEGKEEEEGTEGEGNDASDASDASSSGRGKKTKKKRLRLRGRVPAASAPRRRDAPRPPRALLDGDGVAGAALCAVPRVPQARGGGPPRRDPNRRGLAVRRRRREPRGMDHVHQRRARPSRGGGRRRRRRRAWRWREGRR